MKTFFEYVITPGRPASSSPASRTEPATATNSSRASPRAVSRTAASSTSSERPWAARFSARRSGVFARVPVSLLITPAA